MKIFLRIDRRTMLVPANINSAKFAILKIFLKFGEVSSFKSYLAQTRNLKRRNEISFVDFCEKVSF